MSPQHALDTNAPAPVRNIGRWSHSYSNLICLEWPGHYVYFSQLVLGSYDYLMFEMINS